MPADKKHKAGREGRQSPAPVKCFPGGLRQARRTCPRQRLDGLPHDVGDWLNTDYCSGRSGVLAPCGATTCGEVESYLIVISPPRYSIAGTCTITPGKAVSTFTPVSIGRTIVGPRQTGKNFTASCAPYCTASGSCEDT